MQQLVDLAKRYPNIAYFYAALGNASLAINQIIFKIITRYITPFQALYYRSFLLILINIVLMWREGKSPYITSKQLFKSVILRITCVGGSLTAMFHCLKYLPVSTVTTIWNTGPIFIFFIEAFHYKNAMHMGNFLLTLLSFSGVILMVQPEFIFGESSAPKIEGYYFYVGLMLMSALGNALNMHFIHGLAKKIEPLVNILYSHIGFITISSVLASMHPQRLQPEHANFRFLVLIVAIAITGFVAQTCIVLANSLKRPSLMMPFGYIGVAIGFLADVYLFDTSFTFITVLGIFLTSGGLLSGYLLQKDQKADTRSKSHAQVRQGEKARQNEDIVSEMIQQQKNQHHKT